MIKVSAKLVQKGADRLAPLRALLQKSTGAYATVGWQTDARYPDGTRVAQTAIWNEYGTQRADGGGSPARPFMRPAIDEAQGILGRIRQQQLDALLKQEVTVEDALMAMAFPVQVMIQNRIMSNTPPELADSTAARKKAAGRPAVTLVDTRRMHDECSVLLHPADGTLRRPEDKVQERGPASRAIGSQALREARQAARVRAAETKAKRRDARMQAKASSDFGLSRDKGRKRTAAAAGKARAKARSRAIAAMKPRGPKA